ncbi:transglycosylase domain-containing protein [Alkalimonas collagenimarina]|uniref:peptidoglycan glycosyltransferase n=1 Tax=Alkalimonas collagenimarina TaxID=400390 RepID=A0ABT9GXZ5_9GAMM|nr:transglycosylase domain-containing protein [Alkalimonas collagenimarina]MDP4535838.1 transglycosylase domain-containing protein [Alkalimonas collagenimarina]
MSPRIEPKFGSAPLLKRKDFSGHADERSVTRAKPSRRWWPWLMMVALLLTGVLIWQEIKTSFYQATILHAYGQRLTYTLQSTPSDNVIYPRNGPYNLQRGYSKIGTWQPQLTEQGFVLARQTQFSDALQRFSALGFYPPYPEKQQTGLVLEDCRNEILFQFQYPQRHYQTIDDIAPLMQQLLAYIENKSLLDAQSPYHNPAIEWPRLGVALFNQLKQQVGGDSASGGGSTLATQLEKYRHSPAGRTNSLKDKFHQMVSASVRAYQQSPVTIKQRQQLLHHYINTVPLAAAPGFGEVHGMADGLWAWFGADYQHVSQLLMQSPDHINEETGLALRQVLALIIAQRRPSYYLLQGRESLEQFIDAYLQLLASDGVINASLYNAATNTSLQFITPGWQGTPFNQDQKATTLVRQQLTPLLGLAPYELERLDLTAQSTLDIRLQRQVSQFLQTLRQPEHASTHHLVGHRLLSKSQAEQVHYSLVLYQRTEQGPQLRVQTDTSERAFDLNDQSKLELGSTAKLRVLATYLEIIAELYQRYGDEPTEQLQLLDIAAQDKLSRWLIDQLLVQPGVDLDTLLDQALQRRYSANPSESFFTGGGLHSFSNFMAADNQREPTILEATQESINLPFVRLLADIINYSIYHKDTQGHHLMENDDDNRRALYLANFADREGADYLQQFWRKHRSLQPEQRLQLLLQSQHQRPARVAAVYLWMEPNATEQQLYRFIEQYTSTAVSDAELRRLHQNLSGRQLSLPDQAYAARVHPLELWLVGYLNKHPNSSWVDILTHSKQQRQDVYQWLFRTRHRSARDNRIGIMLEIEAFWDLHYRWQQLGYPFDYLVPSLATALGSSGDRPAALTDLMSVIINDGVRFPPQRLEQLRFAEQTPYETHWHYAAPQGVRVMEPEVARKLQWVLSEVVRDGTARRLQGAYQQLGITGGKTGTGDNRITTVDQRGQRVNHQAINRTATFVFFLGENYYGTITAYVAGADSEQFSFTSALPVQVMKSMEPLLQPHLLQQECPTLPP